MKAQQLKNSILQYAMQGKLVPQNLSDEPASVLLEKIKEEKEQLIKEKVIKREKALSPISEDEMHFEIPDTWEWTRIGDISIVGTGSTPPKDNPNYYKNGTVPWVNSSLTSNLFITQTNSYITDIAVKERNLNIYKRGSLVVALYGQGKTRGQVSELLIDATVNQACAVITEISPKFHISPFLKVFFQKNL